MKKTLFLFLISLLFIACGPENVNEPPSINNEETKSESSGTEAPKSDKVDFIDPADLDDEGWLWFDTQEKVDKYIGQADNEKGEYNEVGKLIQLVSTDTDTPIDSKVDLAFIGVGSDKELGGKDAKTGALIIAPASANMKTDGGGFVVKMPSCSSFNISLSSEGRALVRLLGTTKPGLFFNDFTVTSAKFATLFSPLFRANQFIWKDMEKLDNGSKPTFNLKSSSTIYAYFQSCTKAEIYVHGVKIVK